MSKVGSTPITIVGPGPGGVGTTPIVIVTGGAGAEASEEGGSTVVFIYGRDFRMGRPNGRRSFILNDNKGVSGK